MQMRAVCTTTSSKIGSGPTEEVAVAAEAVAEVAEVADADVVEVEDHTQT